MLAAARQAACLAQRASALAQQSAALPALAVQVTTLTSLSGLARGRSSSDAGWHAAAAACTPGPSGGSSGLLLLPGQAQLVTAQQRPIFNFAGFGGDLCKSHHEKKLLGCALPAQLPLSQPARRPPRRTVAWPGCPPLPPPTHPALPQPCHRSWSPRQVYDVVAGVEHYHRFVPWCQRSTVLLRRPPGYLEAELEVGFQMFVER